MSELPEWRRLSPSTYRRVDRATKLLGVVLVAGGLEVGGHTSLGVALAATGTALAVSTVFVERSSAESHGTTNE